MRESAGGRVIAQLARGTQVTILSQSGGWACISVNGRTGYVKASYLSTSASGGSGSSSGMGNGNSSLNNTSARTNNTQTMRARPDNSSAAVVSVPAGATVTINTYGTVWCSVSYGGYTGYMPTVTLSVSGSGSSSGTTITAANYTAYVKYGNGQLRIYASAGDSTPMTTGSISKDAQVYVRQRAVTPDKTVWLQIQYSAITGWIRQADLDLYTTGGSGSSSATPPIGEGAAASGSDNTSSVNDALLEAILRGQQQSNENLSVDDIIRQRMMGN